jgi:hypothetical protein
MELLHIRGDIGAYRRVTDHVVTESREHLVQNCPTAGQQRMYLTPLWHTGARLDCIVKLITLDDDHSIEAVGQGACRRQARQPSATHHSRAEPFHHNFSIHLALLHSVAASAGPLDSLGDRVFEHAFSARPVILMRSVAIGADMSPDAVVTRGDEVAVAPIELSRIGCHRVLSKIRACRTPQSVKRLLAEMHSPKTVPKVPPSLLLTGAILVWFRVENRDRSDRVLTQEDAGGE